MRLFFTTIILVLLVGAGAYFYMRSSSGITGRNFLVKGSIVVTSPSFQNGGRLFAKYTCDGINVNPTIDIDRVPFDAKSLVLAVVDVDTVSKNFVHWLVYNIDPETTRIEEGVIPPGATVAINDFGKRQYDGPCPPLGIHKYYFRVYALNNTVATNSSLDKKALDKLIKGHIIARGDMFGEYVKN